MARQLADFLGRWAIDRKITNSIGPDGQLNGWAEFTTDDVGLVCTEHGTLQMQGQPPSAASRRTLWRTDGADIAVFFADGRAFHHFDPTAPRASTHHNCPPDLYPVQYDFSDWTETAPVWQTQWRVSGPRKDYTMQTHYRRRHDP